jgi:hypothetical protein
MSTTMTGEELQEKVNTALDVIGKAMDGLPLDVVVAAVSFMLMTTLIDGEYDADQVDQVLENVRASCVPEREPGEAIH